MEKEKNNPKTKGIVATVISVIMILALIGSILSPNNGENETEDKEVKEGVYIGEILLYEDIEICVTDVAASLRGDSNSEYAGLTELIITTTLKNKKKKDFSFKYQDFYIASEDGEKYDLTIYANTAGGAINNALFGETIIAGASRTFQLKCYVPYALEEKNFSMFIDGGALSIEQEYHLYDRETK